MIVQISGWIELPRLGKLQLSTNCWCTDDSECESHCHFSAHLHGCPVIPGVFRGKLVVQLSLAFDHSLQGRFAARNRGAERSLCALFSSTYVQMSLLLAFLHWMACNLFQSQPYNLNNMRESMFMERQPGPSLQLTRQKCGYTIHCLFSREVHEQLWIYSPLPAITLQTYQRARFWHPVYILEFGFYFAAPKSYRYWSSLVCLAQVEQLSESIFLLVASSLAHGLFNQLSLTSENGEAIDSLGLTGMFACACQLEVMGHGIKLRPTPWPSFSLSCYQDEDGEQFLYQLTHDLYNSCWAKQQSCSCLPVCNKYYSKRANCSCGLGASRISSGGECQHTDR
jgi:hypothetical protein